MDTKTNELGSNWKRVGALNSLNNVTVLGNEENGKAKLFVVGEYTGNSTVWAIMGIFSSREKALECCSDKFQRFIGPMYLNEQLPDTHVEWPDIEWPNA